MRHPTQPTATHGPTACLLACLAVGCGVPAPDRQAGTPGAGAVPDTARPAWPASFGFGVPAATARIAAWDIDVRPDGKGLPPGSGNPRAGAAVFAVKCAACHGPTGVEGPNDRLVGRVPGDGFPFGEDLRSWDAKTIGGYWPWPTTLFDYIRRAMPQNAPGSLTPDEVYALAAFLLHRNRIIPGDAEMNHTTLPQVEMPARRRFIPDDRPGYQEVR